MLTATIPNDSVIVTSEGSAKIVKVLCLHGKGGDGSSFKKTLSSLEATLAERSDGKKIRFEFDYVTAPFPMESESKSVGRNGNNDKRGAQWWRLPPGIRSFDADEYIGFDESERIVTDYLHYDLFFGHSQGAILLAALFARSSGIKQNSRKRPLGCILNGVAWPNPFSSHLEAMMHENASSSTTTDICNVPLFPKVLFVIGESDEMNPPEGAIRVREAIKKCNVAVETVSHSGGHSVPVGDSIAMERISAWIMQVVR